MADAAPSGLCRGGIGRGAFLLDARRQKQLCRGGGIRCDSGWAPGVEGGAVCEEDPADALHAAQSIAIIAADFCLAAAQPHRLAGALKSHCTCGVLAGATGVAAKGLVGPAEDLLGAVGGGKYSEPGWPQPTKDDIHAARTSALTRICFAINIVKL